MRILVLQPPKSPARVEDWLLEAVPAAEVVVITATGTARPEPVTPRARLVVVDGDYAGDGVTARLFAECARWRPDRIVANSEDDVQRAGEARTAFGIPGMGSALALAFRDKIRMKALFAGDCLPTVPHRRVQCLEDLLAAQAEFGTLVLKPRAGAGSVGVQILGSPQEATDAVLGDPAVARALHEEALFVERFVDGDVYHVDVVVDGARAALVSPSRYLAQPHRFREADCSSAMLDPDGVEARTLDAHARAFVAGLPGGHGCQVLHVEAFRDREGRFWAGEVAARMGGGLIKDAVEHAFGVDLVRAPAVLAVGAPCPPAAPHPDGLLAGFVLATAPGPRPAAEDLPPWVVEHHVVERADAAGDCVDAAESYLVEGRTFAELQERLAQLHVDLGEGGVAAAGDEPAISTR